MTFVPLSKVLPLSVIGRTTNIHKLSPLHLHIFLMAYSLCYKGKHYRKMVSINAAGIRYNLKTIYGLEVSKDQVKRALGKIVSLGLMERKTAHFKRLIGSQYLPAQQSYYRLLV